MTYPPPPRSTHHRPYGQPGAFGATGYGTAPSQYPHPPAPKNRRRWPWVVAGVVLFLILVVSCNNSRSSTSAGAPTVAPTLSRVPSTQAQSAPELPSNQAQVAPEASPPVASAPADSASPAQPAGPANTMEDGTYEVGVDVAAGKYKTRGGELCYWGRLKKNDGSLGDIIDNDLGQGPKTVTIKNGEYFESQRCGTWSRVG